MAIVLCDTQYREIEELRGIGQRHGNRVTGVYLRNEVHPGTVGGSQIFKHGDVECRCRQRVFLQLR